MFGKWAENGKATGVQEPIIHSFNKDETIIHDFPAYEQIKERKNVLLLGDGLGDIGMVEGFGYSNLIKIGFLNHDAEKHMSEFKKHFDVVINNDSDFNFLNKMLNTIFV